MPKVVRTDDAARPVGPYSQAIKAGGFIFVAGQLALHPVNQQIIDGDIRHQTERALENLAVILNAAGSSLDKVVRCGVFLKDLRDFEAMNEVYAKIFGAHPPVRTTVEVTRLPKDSLSSRDQSTRSRRPRPGWRDSSQWNALSAVFPGCILDNS
jgi:2-iminobutanoate/2-iminopropanoate deaminase